MYFELHYGVDLIFKNDNIFCMEKPDITPFEKALNSLISILLLYSKENDADIRDAVIQRFEYTFLGR